PNARGAPPPLASLARSRSLEPQALRVSRTERRQHFPVQVGSIAVGASTTNSYNTKQDDTFAHSWSRGGRRARPSDARVDLSLSKGRGVNRSSVFGTEPHSATSARVSTTQIRLTRTH